MDAPGGMAKLVLMSKQYWPTVPTTILKAVSGKEAGLQDLTETSPGDAIPSLNVTVMPSSTSDPPRRSTSQGPGHAGADSATQLGIGMHIPSDDPPAAIEHAWQSPVPPAQSLAQHTPSTQEYDSHS